MFFLSPEAVLVKDGVAALQPGDVHVWPMRLEGSGPALQRCDEFLSPAEREKGARFFHEHNRVAYRFAHGLTRKVLGLYCGEEASALEFVAGAFGKPALAPCRPPARAVAFNLSHSHGRMLLAVGDSPELGVDIECVRAMSSALDIAKNYFMGPEYEAIRDAPADLREGTFFRFWTAKEAVIKAQGVGLSAPLDVFHVLFDAANETATVQSFDTERIDPAWWVRVLPCDSGWHAAIAAKGRDWRVRIVDAGQNSA